MGRLRVGINFGNAVLATRDESGSPRGIVLDLAQELSRRMGLAIELVSYESAGRMADDAKAGSWDVAFLAADPDRAEEIAFTEPYLEVDTTYLVQANSSIGSLMEVDTQGIRISVSRKSAYDLFLSRSLKRAELVRASTPGASVDLFFAEQLDALAGLRPILIDVAEKHPGTRLLDGSFMTVKQAIGVPKGQEEAATFLREFVEDIKGSGFLAKTIERNGIRGVSIASSSGAQNPETIERIVDRRSGEVEFRS
jgi:polar amino acid transport system substrate-binding protein